MREARRLISSLSAFQDKPQREVIAEFWGGTAMNPIWQELLNGLLVLVVASLLSVAFFAFQVSFNAQLWVLIVWGSRSR